MNNIMADVIPSTVEQELLGIKQLLWGTDIKADIFRRWSQGFYFSTTEISALEQIEGGPCSIIAPVQAFMIKKLLSEHQGLSFRDAMTEELQHKTLVSALCEILGQLNAQTYYILYLNGSLQSGNSTAIVNGDRDCLSPANDSEITSGVTINHKHFHDSLRIKAFGSLQEVAKHHYEHIHALKAQYGILLFLYSVIMTKGLQQVSNECDSNEPLIDETYGYGSQSLINLMITGCAVTYVWDYEQDVGGLKLKGLAKQSQIGFITLMEHLRYCTVGSFYKNPVHPIWVLGSETHLTVLFSDERRLVSPETKSEQARRVFKNFDKDGNNFISAESLQEVLQALELVSEQEYVEIMRKKLDSENLGIILLNAFMDEFFPKEETSTPDMFSLFHYNGLAQSNINGQVRYQIGAAILLESDIKSMCESNPMLTCLQTKWPTIDVNWSENKTPSLN